MNADYGAPGKVATRTDINAAQRVNLNSDASAFTDEDQSLLIGLADFNASITATRRATNPRSLKEVDSFAYTLNQSTQISGQLHSNRAFTQTQTATLSAAYHQALDSPSAKLKLSSDTAAQQQSKQTNLLPVLKALQRQQEADQALALIIKGIVAAIYVA